MERWAISHQSRAFWKNKNMSADVCCLKYFQLTIPSVLSMRAYSFHQSDSVSQTENAYFVGNYRLGLKTLSRNVFNTNVPSYWVQNRYNFQRLKKNVCQTKLTSISEGSMCGHLLSFFARVLSFGTAFGQHPFWEKYCKRPKTTRSWARVFGNSSIEKKMLGVGTLKQLSLQEKLSWLRSRRQLPCN